MDKELNQKLEELRSRGIKLTENIIKREEEMLRIRKAIKGLKEEMNR